MCLATHRLAIDHIPSQYYLMILRLQHSDKTDNMKQTEHRRRVGTPSASTLTNLGFETRPGSRISWLRFHIISQDNNLDIIATCSSDCKRGLDISTSCDYTLQITITQRLVFSVTVFTALLGNIFQRRKFPASGITSSQAGCYLTPASYFSNCRLRIVS
jgi:hypothetical protein